MTAQSEWAAFAVVIAELPANAAAITRLVPLHLNRRGVELRLVLKGDATAV